MRLTLPYRGLLFLVMVSACTGVVADSDLAELVAIDRSLGLATTTPEVTTELGARINGCTRIDVTCYLRALFGEDSFRPLHRTDSAVENTVSHALRAGEGTCAALAGLALGLTEDRGRPFAAVVFRNHVMLAPAGEDDVFFELLDRGRRMSREEVVTRYGDAGSRAVRLRGLAEFVPYYLDNLAARLTAEERHDAAERAFNEALDRGPRGARIHYNYGTWLIQRERWREADEALSQAIRLGWRDADAFVNRGVARWHLSRLRSAAKDFRKALDLEPGDRRARANLAALERELQPRSPAEP